MPNPTVIKKAMFHVDPSTLLDPHKMDRYSRVAIHKFVHRFELDGYTLEGRPRVRELPWPSNAWIGKSKDGVAYFLPDPSGFPADHPLREPGMIDMEIIASFSKPPDNVRLFVPDSYINKYGLPRGFALAE